MRPGSLFLEVVSGWMRQSWLVTRLDAYLLSLSRFILIQDQHKQHTVCTICRKVLVSQLENTWPDLETVSEWNHTAMGPECRMAGLRDDSRVEVPTGDISEPVSVQVQDQISGVPWTRDNVIHLWPNQYKCHTWLHRSNNQELSLRALSGPRERSSSVLRCVSLVFSQYSVLWYTLVSRTVYCTEYTLSQVVLLYTMYGVLYECTHHSLVLPLSSSKWAPHFCSTSAAQAPSVGKLQLGIGRTWKELDCTEHFSPVFYFLADRLIDRL